MYFEFSENDKFINSIETNPQWSYVITLESSYINNMSGSACEPGYISLYGRNKDLGIYQYVYKGSEQFSIRQVSSEYDNYSFGDIISGSTFPLTSTIDVSHTTAIEDEQIYYNLKNLIRKYKIYHSSFDIDNMIGGATIISVPKIFYDKQIKPGTLVFDTLKTGTIEKSFADLYGNGVIYETTGVYSGSTSGLVFYDEGLIIMTGSMGPYCADVWGKTDYSSTPDLYEYQMNFKGVSTRNVLTLFAHANRGELNYSTNPTFLTSHQKYTASVVSYTENKQTEIYNVVTSSLPDTTGTFQKQTYISKIGIYDEFHKLIAIVSLSVPVRKKEKDNYMFKMRLDL